MNRAPRKLFFSIVALMTLALVGNPMASTAMAAPPQEQQQAVAAASAKPEGSDPVWGEANWQLANRFASYKMSDLSYSTSVSPVWIEGTDDNFWYSYETSAGREFILVDPTAATKAPIFDNDRIAAELTRITKDPYDGQHLPITSIRFMDPDTIQFDVTSSQDEEEEEEEEETEGDQQDDTEDEDSNGGAEKKVHHFEYTVSTRMLRELDTWEEPDSHPGWANVSPDEQWVVFGRNFNLYMMSYEDYEKILDARRGESGQEAEDAENEVEVTEIQLTDDGVEHYGYVGGGRGQTDNDREENKDDRMRPGITWAHDSSRFAMLRSDRREVGDLWVVHVIGNDRPELETYKYDLPGEENVSQRELVLFDMASREMSKLEDANIWQDQTMSIYSAREFTYRSGPSTGGPSISKWLSPNPDELYFRRRSRDQHRIDVVRYSPTTGESTVVIEERLNTYIEDQQPELLENGDLIWWSERDGWAHLYRFASDGTEVARLTEGPWAVRRLLGVDEEAGAAFFIGNAREPGEDPYFNHLYRVGIDGTGLRLLNPGNFDHSIGSGEGLRYFVDNFSRVDTTPSAVVIDRDGEILLDLEDADLSKLLEAGYKYPEAFGVKSADGVTDIYGVIYKPFDFDPSKKYPIVAYVYPGPQTESVAKAFRTSPSEVALAQLGMIVITIGNRGGNPARSKWYHNYGYGDLRDYGLADKKAGIEQLADRHAWIDIDRVGIYGHSGGGFMSTAAMLVYPDFFKVAVSSSGNHNNDVYNLNWSEKHDGVKEVIDDEGNVTFEYDIETNSDLAANLKGHLLLTTGDVDNNVHHAGTFRMAEALIRANKRFDFFIFPGARHGYGSMGNYWFWLRAEYFAQHLLGAERPETDVMELNNEQPQAGGRGVSRRTGGNSGEGNNDGGEYTRLIGRGGR